MYTISCNMKEMLYEVRCLKSNEDLKISYLHLTSCNVYILHASNDQVIGRCV